MAILQRDAEDAYNFLSKMVKKMKDTHFENAQMYSLIYLKDLKTLKSYASMNDYITKYTEALPRFEMGYAKFEYLKGNPDYIDKDNNEPCNE